MTRRQNDTCPFPRIGLFGGTFNPVHRGHLRVAADVADRFELDRVYLIPSAQPPHKATADLAPAAERYEMVRLAAATQERILACDIEIMRSGPSYTIDTVLEFRKRYPDSRLYFLVGLDAFLEIDSWKSYHQLFEQIAFIVMTRPGAGQERTDWRRTAASFAKQHISRHYSLDAEKRALEHPFKHTIFLTAVKPMDIAATDIRKRVRAGEDITPWVLPEVAAYILKKGLYR